VGTIDRLRQIVMQAKRPREVADKAPGETLLIVNPMLGLLELVLGGSMEDQHVASANDHAKRDGRCRIESRPLHH
jgi:hypothetical protein